MPIAKPAYWSPVAPLSGIRQFFSRNLVKLTPCLTPPRIYPKSNKARKLPFNKADDELFLLRQEIFGRYMAIISEWMGKRCWPWDHPWSRTWQKESPGLAQVDKEHFFGTQGPRFSTHQSSSAGHAGHAIVWSIVFLFAERNFRLCVNRNFDTIFDPVLPEPNRIFGLLKFKSFDFENMITVNPEYFVCILFSNISFVAASVWK